MKLWRRVFRAQFPLELRVRTAPLGLSVSPSETSPGTRLCVYLFSCVISAFNLNVVMSRAHRAVVAAGAEKYPLYGQPHVDRDSRALHDRVAALEKFQSGEFDQLQQELRYQKAKVAQATQTASNIQVELGTQVVRLHDRVAALEKLAYAASSSSASHQG
ncbi:hypothetical protein PC121_g20676 [Phytophthora cactorum]|nr:hypothetical protein PC121_g20676 [Phytophthora cactorum]